MASKSPDNNKSLARNIDEAKNVMMENFGIIEIYLPY